MRPTETTQHLIRALKGARSIDLDKLFASALDIEVTNYTDGSATIERVSVSAQYAAPLVAGLIAAIENTLRMRVESLERDLRQTKEQLGGLPKSGSQSECLDKALEMAEEYASTGIGMPHHDWLVAMANEIYRLRGICHVGETLREQP